MRKLLPLALAALGAPALGAQTIFDSELRLAPQYMQYQIKSSTTQTISEFALPVFVSIPLGPSFTFDVGTAFARAVSTNQSGSATTTSEISGLTDTQLRGNLTLGNDFVVLTGGVNLPTGQSSVTQDQLSAAGLIGSDFLSFPISNMGTGLAATAGIAIARPLGDWNVGFGGALRHSTEYEPFNIPTATIKFTPGDEVRARIGADRTLGTGRLQLGLTYSAFGNDNAGGSVYNTGNRLIAQAAVTNTMAGKDVTIAGYNVFRAPGMYANGDPAGRENILNLYLGVALNQFIPSVEIRQWMQDIPGATSGSTTTTARSQTSMLSTIGLRTHMDVAGFTLYPSAGYTIGSLATVDESSAPIKADLTGFRAQLAIRMTP